jgi:hypothetical protein
MQKADPISKRYYYAVELADLVNAWLFYAGALLSILVLIVNPSRYPDLYGLIFVLFVIVVVLFFAVTMSARLYFTPRAEQKRRQDFLTSAFGVSLTHENTCGYYNNDFKEPPKKIAAQLLENSFFSKSLTLKIAQNERLKTAGYFAIWLTALVCRKTDVGVILAATQALFSEQILSRMIRIEWFRSKCERVHDDVYRLFQTALADDRFLPMALDSLLLYETAKSNAAVVIPSKLFKRMNAELSVEWEKIREKLAF